jgi:myo-inositol-1(or 4)-monophosphatase
VISERDSLALLNVAESAVSRASDLIRTRSPGQLRFKGDRDLASEVDLAVERSVRAFLGQKTPDIGFLGEEEGSHGFIGSELRWILDPIDGTVNFLHGYPLCAVAIALV